MNEITDLNYKSSMLKKTRLKQQKTKTTEWEYHRIKNCQSTKI